MKKRIYVKDMPSAELTQRIHSNEKFFTAENKAEYIYKRDGFLVRHFADGAEEIGTTMNTGDPSLYVLEEVEEAVLAGKESIGKTCCFWNGPNDPLYYDTLTCINYRLVKPYSSSSGDWYQYCSEATEKEKELYNSEENNV